MSATSKEHPPRVVNASSSSGLHSPPPCDDQNEARAADEASIVGRPSKKHAASPVHRNTPIGTTKPSCGLPLLTFLNTQPWIRASLCRTAPQKASDLPPTAFGPAANTTTLSGNPCCFACGGSAFSSMPQPQTSTVPAAKNANVFHGNFGDQEIEESIRLPVEATFITAIAPESPLVFAHDPTVFARPPPPTLNTSYDARVSAPFPAVIAVIGDDLRLAVSPKIGATEDIPGGEGDALQKCSANSEGDFEQGNRTGVVSRSDGWNNVHWKHCFLFSRDAIVEPPRIVEAGGATFMKLPLHLLTLTLRSVTGSASEDNARLTALSIRIFKAKSSHFEDNRVGNADEYMSEVLSPKSCEAVDQAQVAIKEIRTTSSIGLSNALEGLIHTGVGLVMPRQPVNSTIYGSSEMLAKFAESAAAADRALTQAVRRARDWTSFALTQPSSGSAGGVLTVEQIRERRQANRALYPRR